MVSSQTWSADWAGPRPPAEGQDVTCPPRRLRTPSICASVLGPILTVVGDPVPLRCVDWTLYAQMPVLEPRESASGWVAAAMSSLPTLSQAKPETFPEPLLPPSAQGNPGPGPRKPVAGATRSVWVARGLPFRAGVSAQGPLQPSPSAGSSGARALASSFFPSHDGRLCSVLSCRRVQVCGREEVHPGAGPQGAPASVHSGMQ